MVKKREKCKLCGKFIKINKIGRKRKFCNNAHKSMYRDRLHPKEKQKRDAKHNKEYYKKHKTQANISMKRYYHLTKKETPNVIRARVNFRKYKKDIFEHYNHKCCNCNSKKKLKLRILRYVWNGKKGNNNLMLNIKNVELLCHSCFRDSLKRRKRYKYINKRTN